MTSVQVIRYEPDLQVRDSLVSTLYLGCAILGGSTQHSSLLTALRPSLEQRVAQGLVVCVLHNFSRKLPLLDTSGHQKTASFLAVHAALVRSIMQKGNKYM
jgi:hypothetical protein